MKLIKNLSLILLIHLFCVSMLSAGSISGKVSLHSSTGLSGIDGADVFAFKISNFDSLSYSTTTDEDGNYTLENLPAGDYEVMATSNNLIGENNVLVSLGENETLIGIDFQLDGTILYEYYDNLLSGTVKNVNTGELIGGVAIELLSSSADSNAFAFCYSLDDGTFEMTDIEPGDYSLSAHGFGYAKYNHNSIITIVENSKITQFQIELTPFSSNASLLGTITNSATSEPVKDVQIFISGENYITPLDSMGWAVKTDENGNYTIDNLISGKYWYFTELEGYESTWGEVEVNGSTILDISLKELVSGTVEGIVLDEDDNPQPNVVIDFISAKDDNFNYTFAVTNSEGKYSAEVGIGDYYVLCHINGFDSTKINESEFSLPHQIFYENATTIEEATIVSVQKNQIESDINFTIPSIKEIEVVVTGSVKDENGNGIEGAVIEALFEDYYYISRDSILVNNNGVSTDVEGNYSLTVVQNSYGSITFTLFAYKDGFAIEYYNEQSEWYLADLIKANESCTKVDINFTLLNEAEIYNNSISGQVADEDGNGLVDVLVSVVSVNGYNFEEARTDEDGNYKIPNLKDEDYIISFFSLDNFIPELYDDVFTWEEATPIKASGDVVGIDAILTKGEVGSWDSSRTVLGNISDITGEPIANVIVVLKNSEGKAVAAARTDGKGNYKSLTKSKMISEAVISRIGYESTTKLLDKYSPVSNTVILNVLLHKSITDVDNSSNETMPSKFILQQNYPNPFNPTTVINFSLPLSQHVKLEVFNLLGENVATLIDKPMNAGNHKYKFEASNFNSGLYLYRISAGNFVDVKKMMLLK